MSSLSLKSRALRGTAWTVVSYGTSQMLRFGANLILTRLLFPDLFGLMALVNVFVLGLQLFSDIGIGTSIVQNKRGDEAAFLNTAWTMQVMRGGLLWLGTVAIAFPIAQLYERPELLWLLPMVGLTTVISGFNSTALFTLNRHLSIAQLALFEVGGQVIGLTTMIVWAWIHPTIWALVVGTLVSALVKMVWSHFLLDGPKNRFFWDRIAAGELFRFGRWIFLSTALTFLAGQSDRLILGKAFSLELLGVYTIAFTLSDLPRQVVLAVSGKVIFPSVSRLAELPRPEFRQIILRSREPVLALLALSLAVLVCFGDRLILALYDNRYDQAAWMLPLLAAGIWFNMLSQTIDPCLFAIGQPRYAALGNLLRFGFTLVGIPLGFALMGVAGAVAMVALNDVPFYGAIAYGLRREGLFSAGQDLRATGIFVGAVLALLAARGVMGLGFPLEGL